MWKKLTLLALTIAMVTLAVAAVVNADSVAGDGWIDAEGDGRACMSGNANAISISGNGVLWYFDDGEEDEPTITGEGYRKDFASGWARWKGFDGEFTLTDADEIIVCLRGQNIHLWAEGTGAVALAGEGHYETGGNDIDPTRGYWTLAGLNIQLGQ